MPPRPAGAEPARPRASAQGTHRQQGPPPGAHHPVRRGGRTGQAPQSCGGRRRSCFRVHAGHHRGCMASAIMRLITATMRFTHSIVPRPSAFRSPPEAGLLLRRILPHACPHAVLMSTLPHSTALSTSRRYSTELRDPHVHPGCRRGRPIPRRRSNRAHRSTRSGRAPAPPATAHAGHASHRRRPGHSVDCRLPTQRRAVPRAIPAGSRGDASSHAVHALMHRHGRGTWRCAHVAVSPITRLASQLTTLCAYHSLRPSCPPGARCARPHHAIGTWPQLPSCRQRRGGAQLHVHR